MDDDTVLDATIYDAFYEGFADDDLCLTLPGARGLGFIATMDLIRALRHSADAEEAALDYDPHDFTARRVAAMRKHAAAIETVMETRLGWTR